eukprot:TRINITY_DN2238_c0_g1_i2.p1 TRINITY_DN2238_c0_g1~~TRINITY_DN2238_c0_g1_i2.p1  ORF type:complete len:287 (-),score=45.57 TRINITY_DN2238_c0_g1_i2:154-1014(-)
MRPKIAIIGGSGFYAMEELSVVREHKTSNRFGTPSAAILEGHLGNNTVYLMSRHGTGHSVPPAEINYRANIWALKELGVTHVLAATACGSLKEEISPGSFVLVDSFIDRTQGRAQSFYGNGGFSSVAHVPMEPAFCAKTRDVIYNTCQKLGYKTFKEGTVVTIQGPRFSSRAESNMYRSFGAHVINMTTVPEVCLAKEAGMSYAAIALATDYDCWKEDNQVDTPSVLKILRQNVQRVREVLVETVKSMMEVDWDQTIINNRTIATNSVIGGSTSISDRIQFSADQE